MYKKVIDILSGNEVNFRDIAISIAKSNPSIFVKAYEKSIFPEMHHEIHVDCLPRQTAKEYFIEKNGTDYLNNLSIGVSQYVKLLNMYGHKSWLPGVLGFLFPLDRPEKIKAIKLLRQETGLGLRAAKDFCEAIAEGDVPEIENYNYI